MKSILFNFAVVFGFILSATGVLRAQYVVDTVRYQPVDTIRTAPENDRQLRKTAENPDVYQNGNTAGNKQSRNQTHYNMFLRIPFG